MNRRLLPLAMLVSLWPLAFIAVSLANASNHSNSNSESVQVTVPSSKTTPRGTPKTATVPLRLGGKITSVHPGRETS